MRQVIKCLLLIFFLLLFKHTLRAQTFEYEKKAAEYAVNGIINITSSVIADTYVPMTHYNKGDYSTTLAASYTDVQTVYEDPDIESEDLNAKSATIGGGYALTDKLLLYGIFSSLYINGNLSSNFYELSSNSFSAETDYKLFSFLSGIGFDFLPNNSSWSIPISLGVSIQHYSAKIIYPEFYYNNPPTTYSLSAEISGTEILYGCTASIAISYNYKKKLTIAPYFLYLKTFNNPEIETNISQDITSPVPFSQNFQHNSKLDKVSAGMIGFSMSYLSDDSLKYTINVGSYLASYAGYNKKVMNGLKFRSIVLAVSYNGNNI